MASRPSKYREIPVDQVHEGCWVKYRFLGVVSQGTLELFADTFLVLPEDGLMTPVFSRRADGKFRVSPLFDADELHVYEKVEDEEAEPSGDDEIGDVDMPEPEPPCHVDDWVRLTQGVETIESSVLGIERCDKCGGWHIAFEGDRYDSRLVSDDGSHWVVEKVVPRFDDDGLPNRKGFYKAATGSVWKWDGKMFAPVLDHDGNPAPAMPVAAVGRERFRRDSIKKHRFPFVKVTVTVDEA